MTDLPAAAITEPIFDKLRDELTRHHFATISHNTTPGGVMSNLSTAITAARNDFDNLAGWVNTFGQHLPAIAAEAERVQASPITQVLEGVTLTPAEEAMVARLIGELAALRGAQAATVAAEALVQATIPADAPSPADAAAEPASQPA